MIVSKGLDHSYGISGQFSRGFVDDEDIARFNHSMRKLSANLRARNTHFAPEPVGKDILQAVKIDDIIAQLEALDEMLNSQRN